MIKHIRNDVTKPLHDTIEVAKVASHVLLSMGSCYLALDSPKGRSPTYTAKNTMDSLLHTLKSVNFIII